jgi:ferredoxin--NADP+ reductase
MSTIGTESSPLRVAIIGSGPSAFYAADHLLKQNLVVQIDLFDRLPTPYGLVRGGVAPDHAKIKSVTKVYDRIAANPNVRFYGNVQFGKDISHADLKAHYHQIVYAVGAQSDRRLGIPGEDLKGSDPATEFVGWYNGHPDYRDRQFDLSQERVAVIGVGNVAVDVVRSLASSYEELRGTDIADYALEALRNSRVREIYLLGRRGPAQGAFTNPEIKELGSMAEADVIVRPDEATLDPLSRAWLEANRDSNVEKNVELLVAYSQRPPAGKRKRVHMRFLVSPVEITGEGHVQAIKLVKNELHPVSDGSLRPRPTDVYETLPVGLVFRSIGYRGVPLPDLPFDQKAGIIPNQKGRVIDPATQQPIPGEYVVGWIKRGPTGIIGTNKPDSQETANLMLEDIGQAAPLDPACASRESMERLVFERKPDAVTWNDWLLLDQMEIENGQAVGRPRLKFSRIEDMINALKARKRAKATSQ